MRIVRIGLGLGLVSVVSFAGCGGSENDATDGVGGSGGAGGSESTTGGSASGTGAAASDCEDLAIGTCSGGRSGTGGGFPGIGGRASGGEGGVSAGGQGGNNFAGSAGSGPGPEECSCTIAQNPPASVDCDDVVWRCVGDAFEGEDFAGLGCSDAGLGFMNAQRYCCPEAVDLCE